MVIEGLDGAGTTTQTGRLARRFERANHRVFSTFEPTGSPTGAFIRRILTGNERHGDAPFRPGEAALALLFAADRAAHSVEIERLRAGGTHVVCDRYVFSSMAYQSLGDTIDGPRVVEINAGCAVPSLTVLLDVPIDMCLRRLAARGDADSIYERRDLLERIRTHYDNLRALYTQHYGPLEVVDGTAGEDAVENAVVEAIRRHLPIEL